MTALQEIMPRLEAAISAQVQVVLGNVDPDEGARHTIGLLEPVIRFISVEAGEIALARYLAEGRT